MLDHFVGLGPKGLKNQDPEIQYTIEYEGHKNKSVDFLDITNTINDKYEFKVY